MSGEDHVPSYYLASAKGIVARPSLEGEVEVDVCVVGGGFTGLSTALNLAEKGYQVAVLEAERVGWGASGRNGGQINTDFPCGIERIRDWVGPDDARKLWALGEESKAIIRERVERHEIDCDLTWGLVLAAEKRRQLAELKRTQEFYRRDYDYRKTEIVERDELRGHVDSEIYLGGMTDAGAGHLHPLNYCLGLARAAEEAGVRIFEDSRVVAFDSGGAPSVTTERGRVRARFLVLCCNAYLGDLVPRIRRKIMPVGTYIGATEVLGENRARGLIPRNEAVCDCKFVLNYFRLSADHRLLFGGRVSYSTLAPRDLPAAMRRSMLEVFPGLEDVGFDFAWGGYVAITMERTPHLGRFGQSTYFAHGFSGQGVALTGVAGKIMAEAIAGQAERFDLFTRLPHTTFPGGRLLRTPTLALAMLWYRMRDLLP